MTGILIRVSCDGTTNTVMDIRRLRHPVGRASGGAINYQGDEDVLVIPFSALPAGVQTALTNFVNAVDAK
jgi:hypothetical protein